MDDLLPFYEQELAFLRTYANDFAERFPKIAARLGVTSEAYDDPHVERLIQAFSLLTARVRKKLEDDYPEFTSALLGVIYPHYLRPFPSCSIACVDALAKQVKTQRDEEKNSDDMLRIERGTKVVSKALEGGCVFRTGYDVVIMPINIVEARFVSAIHAPSSIKLPSGTGAEISCTLSFAAKTAEAHNLATLPSDTLRVYMDGEPSFVATLRDAIFLRRSVLYAEFDDDGKWYSISGSSIREVGFAEDEVLIDYPARTHPAYRILTEYFSFPEKFNFFDIDLNPLFRLRSQFKRITLHLCLTSVRTESNVAHVLENLSVKNFRLRCTPIINLFKTAALPINISHLRTHYTVTPNRDNLQGSEIYSIDKVALVRKSHGAVESVTEFRPFYSLRHGEDKDGLGKYWIARRDETLAQSRPGFETEIAIIDDEFNPNQATEDILSLDLTCTNRDIPSTLSIGSAAGDVTLIGYEASVVKLLRRPTRSLRFPEGQANQWRLISHLSLNHLSLVKTGLDALQEMLRLYDVARNPVTQRQITGVTGLEYKSTTAWLPGKPFATFVRGTEIILFVDEDSFVGTSLHCFVKVLQHFFQMYVHINSFVDLVVRSKKTGEEIIRCAQLTGLAHQI